MRRSIVLSASLSISAVALGPGAAVGQSPGWDAQAVTGSVRLSGWESSPAEGATLDQFIERYSVDVSHGGIFIRTKDPLAVGTQLRFEFQLQDASPLISGEGTVVWTREHDPAPIGIERTALVERQEPAPVEAFALVADHDHDFTPRPGCAHLDELPRVLG